MVRSIASSLSAAAAIMGTMTAGCADDEVPPPASTCASFESVTGSPSFAFDVMPVFQLSCNFSPCHDAMSSNPAEGLVLGPRSGEAASQPAIDAVHAGLVGVDATRADEKLVVAGSPEQSFLIGKLHYRDDPSFNRCGFDCEDCGTLMPQGNLEPMDAARIELIAAWIQSGALNN